MLCKSALVASSKWLIWGLVLHVLLIHNKNAAVVLIGRGEMEAELKSLTRELQVSNRVLFLGFLTIVR